MMGIHWKQACFLKLLHRCLLQLSASNVKMCRPGEYNATTASKTAPSHSLVLEYLFFRLPVDEDSNPNSENSKVQRLLAVAYPTHTCCVCVRLSQHNHRNGRASQLSRLFWLESLFRRVSTRVKEQSPLYLWLSFRLPKSALEKKRSRMTCHSL